MEGDVAVFVSDGARGGALEDRRDRAADGDGSGARGGDGSGTNGYREAGPPVAEGELPGGELIDR